MKRGGIQNIKLLGSEHLAYMELLASGNIYRILISKRLLFRPLLPMWAYFLALFCIKSGTLFAMVGIPSMIVFAVFLVNLYPYWHACKISKKAYAFFHIAAMLCLYISSFAALYLSEVLYELFIL